MKTFDICKSNNVSGVNEGFIHSPNYPNYYGNNRNCFIDVPLQNDEQR